MKLRALAVVFALLITARCGITDPPCDICSIWAEVRGTVRLESGAPVAAASVEIALMSESRTTGGDRVCVRDGGSPAAR